MTKRTDPEVLLEIEVEDKQQDLLGDILELYSEVESLQKEINKLVEENKSLPEKYRDKDMDESIESYFTYDL